MKHVTYRRSIECKYLVLTLHPECWSMPHIRHGDGSGA